MITFILEKLYFISTRVSKCCTCRLRQRTALGVSLENGRNKLFSLLFLQYDFRDGLNAATEAVGASHCRVATLGGALSGNC